jgi:hypothetical protein
MRLNRSTAYGFASFAVIWRSWHMVLRATEPGCAISSRPAARLRDGWGNLTRGDWPQTVRVTSCDHAGQRGNIMAH